MHPSQIKLICSKYNIVPSKSKGQNFLIDEKIAASIVNAAKLSLKDVVMEVGPGLGILTNRLIAMAGKVLAVELDKNALAFLRAEFAGQEKLQIIESDILRLNLNELAIQDGKYKIISNLPYNITSFFLRYFLEKAVKKPSEMVLMLQKEVAERICAKPGEMSLLSLSARFYGEPEILFVVKRDNFWPAPAVDSAVIRIKFRKKPPQTDAAKMFRVARVGFSSRRKQLHNNLSAGLKIGSTEAKKLLAECGLKEAIRAQDLKVEDWIGLSEKIG